MKTLLRISLALTVLLVLWWLYQTNTKGLPVETAQVRYGEIRQFVDEEGKTRLPKTYLVTMPYDGRIESIDLTEGTPVSEGQVVARVVPVDLELEWKTAESNVERLKASITETADKSVEKTGLKQSLSYVESMNLAVDAAEKRVGAGKAKYEFHKRNLGRVKTLAEQGQKVQEELNRAELALVEAEVDYQQDILVHRALQALQAATALLPTAIEQYMGRKDLSADVLQKELAQAKFQLEQSTTRSKRGEMVSPVNGVVLSRPVANERHQAAGTVLMEIGRLDDLEIEADILSQDVVDVKPGDEVEIYGPSIGPQPAHGTIGRIYPAGFTKVSSLGVEQQRVKVIIYLRSDELYRLRIERDLGVGYRVNVRIYTDKNPHALVIPRSALFRGAAGDWQVFAVRDRLARLTSIEVGLMNDDLVEVASGLAEGDQVVLAPETSLTDGKRLAPVGQ
jgi:HlyD family secretion protein